MSSRRKNLPVAHLKGLRLQLDKAQQLIAYLRVDVLFPSFEDAQFVPGNYRRS